MKTNILITIVIGLLGTIGLIMYVDAEISRDKSAIEGIDYKIFVFGQNPENILSRTNAEYEINGYPSIQILVRNWDKLTPLEQITITNELNSMGYFEVVG